jgi:phage gpG-like protein
MISLEAQIYRDEALPMLKRLRERMPTIDRTVRGAIADRIVGHIQADKLRGQVLRRRSGDLASHTHWRHLSQIDTAVGVYGVIYARIHELGGIIRAKNGGYLKFRSRYAQTRFSAAGNLMKGGRARGVSWGWVSVKEVHMPKRPYLLPGINEVFESGEAMNVADRVLATQLAKIEGTS